MEARHGSWDKELASPGLASELVPQGPGGTRTHMRSVPGRWINRAVRATLHVCVGVGTTQQELPVGRPNLTLLTLKVDTIFISVLK